MIRLCAWCGKTLPTLDPDTPGTTHGICDTCFLEQTSKIPVKPTCLHDTDPGQFCTSCEAENTGLRSKA